MSEKITDKKTAQVTIERNTSIVPSYVVARSFIIKENPDSPEYLDILLDAGLKGVRTERIIFDAKFTKDSPENFSNYLARLTSKVNDSAMANEIVYPPHSYFANLLHIGHSGDRAETAFSVVSLCDWGNAVKRAKPGSTLEFKSTPIVSVFSSTGFQKKFVSELLRIVTNKS